MKLSLVVALACLASATATHAAPSFAGAWSQPWCGGEQRNTPCGEFSLYLVQDGTRICGNHFAATPGGGRLNEGSANSVVGTVIGTGAVLAITSGRTNVTFLAKVQRSGNSLMWRLVEQVTPGEQPEPPLISVAARLEPKAAKEVLAQVAHECMEHFKNAP